MGVGTNTPTEMLDVSGALKIGTDFNNNAGAPTGGAGTIRWNGSNFQGWDGTQWITFSGASAAGWELLGNAGTNPATNFIGTSDNQSLRLRTNNIERMSVMSTGSVLSTRVGIGTNTASIIPVSQSGLEIAGNVPQLVLNDLTGGAQDDFRIINGGGTVNFDNATTNTTLIALGFGNYTNNVGIGTTTPQATLEVQSAEMILRRPSTFSGTTFNLIGDRHNGNTGWNGQVASNGIGSIEFTNQDASNGNTVYSSARIQSTNIGASNDGDLRFYTANDLTLTESMRIDNDGNVGIGADPSNKLHVEGSIRMVDGNQAVGYIPVSDANGTMTWTDPTTLATADDGDWLVNGTHIYKGNSGNVGIGTTTPSTPLEVINASGNSISTNHGIHAAGTGVTTGFTFNSVRMYQDSDNSVKWTKFGSPSIGFTYDQNGNVGIGTTTPDVKLELYNAGASTEMYLTKDGTQTSSLLFRNGTSGTQGTSLGLGTAEHFTIQNNIADKDIILNVNDGGVQTDLVALDASTGRVGIGTTTPEHLLDVNGDMGVNNSVFHNGDPNTYLSFTPDRIQLFAGSGSSSWIDMQHSATEMAINENGINRDLRVEGGTDTDLLFVDGSADMIGVSTNTPSATLDVEGTFQLVDGSEGAGKVLVSDAAGNTSWTDPSAISGLNELVDADGDTKIQVEEGTDDDIIRFDVDGVQAGQIAEDVSEIETLPGFNQPDGLLKLEEYGLLLKGNGTNGGQVLTLEGQLPGSIYPYGRIDFRNTDNSLYTGASIRSHNDGSVNDGDLRFMTANNQVLSEVARMTSTGFLGVGTATPATALHVAPTTSAGPTATFESGANQYPGAAVSITPSGHATSERASVQIDDWHLLQDRVGNGTKDFSLWQQSTGSHRLTVSNTGNVGIGDVTPKWPTTVASTNALFSATDVIDPDLYALTITRPDGTNDQGIGIGLGGSNSGDHAGAGIAFKKTGNNSLGDLMLTVKANGTSFGDHFPALTIKSLTGNTGIGTTAPGEKLHVEGSVRMVDGNQAVGFIPVSDANGTMTWTDPAGVITGDAWGLQGNSGTTPGTDFIGTTDAQDLRIKTSNTDRVAVMSTGGVLSTRVGIGTTTVSTIPGTQSGLEIAGNVPNLVLNDLTGGAQDDFRIINGGGVVNFENATTNSTIMTLGLANNSDNVGIGTATPTQKLHVTDGTVLFDRNSNGTNTQNKLTIAGRLEGNVFPYASIDLQNADGNSGNTDYVGASVRSHNNGASNDGDLRFLTASDGVLTEAMKIDHFGLVGIGTSPVSELHLQRDQNATTSIRIQNDDTGVNSTERLDFVNEDGTVAAIAVYDDGNPAYPNQMRMFNNRPNGEIDLSNSNGNVRLDENGNVGIGTNSPTTKLDVEGDVHVNANGVIFTDTQNGGAYVELRASDPVYPAEGVTLRTLSNPANGEPIFRVMSSGGAERLRVEHSGAVSIDNTIRIQGGSPAIDKVLTATNGNGDAVWTDRSSYIAYNEQAGTFNHNNSDGWGNVTGTFSLDVTNGDVLELKGQASVRLTGGSGTDDFDFRVTYTGCANGSSNLINFRPDEGGSEHDNFTPIPYQDIMTAPCTGTLNFTFQIRNTGDDAWQAQDRIMVVRKN